MNLLSDETSLNGKIYESPAVPPLESSLPVPLPPLPSLGTGIVIGRLLSSSDATAEAVVEYAVAAEAPSRSRQMMRWRLMKNEGKYYYYFTTTYSCSVYLSISSVQTINFDAPPIDFDLSECILKCVLLSQLLS